MRTLLMLVALLGTMESLGADPATDFRTLELSWDLLRSASYGQSPKEHAAFLVRDDDGELQLVKWPWGAESRRASYNGAIPVRTVAVVHTHPSHLPNPSHGDAALALRLGLPVYVLTRNRITRTHGGRTELVARGDWNPSR